MGFVEIESHFMQIEELKFILAGLGVSSFFGVSVHKEQIPKKEELNRILISLYQKDIIDWEDEKIAVKQPFADIFYVLSNCKKCVVVRGESGQGNTHCCYFWDNQVVVIEKSQREENSICITILQWDIWTSYIEECVVAERMYMSESNLLRLELCSSSTGNLEGVIFIKEQGLQTSLIESFSKKERSFPYDGELLKQRIELWLWEAER